MMKFSLLVNYRFHLISSFVELFKQFLWTPPYYYKNKSCESVIQFINNCYVFANNIVPRIWQILSDAI